MTKVLYFVDQRNHNPVKEFIETLEERHIGKIQIIFKLIERYGLSSAINHVKRLIGLPLWEIRILGKGSIRVLFAVIVDDSIVILHGFKKKSQKTPRKEIELALRRLSLWKEMNRIDK